MVALGILVSRVALSVRAMTYSWEDMVRLAKFGGWVTVSRIIVPLTGYFDRFAIATLVSLKALSVYAPPVEIATRFLMVPSAMAKVLLPAISSRSLDNDLTGARLLNKGIKFSLLAMFPLALLVVLFAEEGLRWWLSSELALQGKGVLQLMMISVFINSIGYPAAMLLLGFDRPDYSAKIQLIGMPLYVLAVWNIVPAFGIVGAAATWTLRTALDTAAHLWLARNVLKRHDDEFVRLIAASTLGVGVLFAAMLIQSHQVGVMLIATSMLGVVSWLLILDSHEKEWLRSVVFDFGLKRYK